MSAPIVEIVSGRLSGRARDGVTLFAGIPYAEAPVGDRRFGAPHPHPGWTGVREATSFGKVAPQGVGATEAMAGGGPPDWSEDCLFLNVQTPACDAGRRPVLVWIHGGGFTSGAGSIPWYDGSAFCRNGDVVVVTINYRLGAFGFLHLAGADANPGLADQVAALAWVRDNIAAFGGDPGNVTVFGESAGGMSVATLLAVPSARGLFHKAVPQSGAAHHTQDPDRAAEVTERIESRLGVRGVAGLRSVPAEALLEAQLAAAVEVAQARAASNDDTGLALPFCPVVDGAFLPEAPLDAIRAGRSAPVPLLTGTNRDEWNLFALMGRSPADEAALLRRLGRLVEDPHELMAIYRESADTADHDAIWSAVMTDRAFRIPAVRLVEAHARQRPDATWLYQFDWASSAFGGRLGSCHALEIPFVFHTLDRKGVALFTGDGPPAALADAMHQAWIAFARSGNPQHDRIPAWAPYDEIDRTTLHLDLECRITNDPSSRRRAIWAGRL
ncbi:MAG: carboxylesterase/lipase family protein [Acidimicrobiales bacterium]